MMKKKNKKFSISGFILVIVLLAGLSLLLYPSVANWWNTRLFKTDVTHYTQMVAHADNNELEEMFQRAREYNREHVKVGNIFYPLTDEEMAEYNSQLNLDHTEMSMMGYLTIPKLNLSLPIYHTTSDATLSAGIGHLEGTSLPIGGESTHTVLSGHRGLPSARLLTDLDKMTTGDTFVIETLGMTLTYEVDQILIVLPEEVSGLQIEEGKDLCTMITCTPYGVNTHRLLVRGHRIDNINSQEIRIIADAIQIDTTIVAPFVAVPILLVLLIMLFVGSSKRNRNRNRNRKKRD